MTHDPDQLNRFLKYKVIKGFREAGLPMTQPYLERIDFELGIIKQMGFDQYFLIVADLCRFMRSKKIKFLVRGSGCGSCVVWGLRISHKWLDPIQYGLPFERFLNPSRVTMPDLDIDIQDDRRHEVVTYTLEKYGRDRVARIITFGTMGAKVAIADTCRALQIENYQEVAAKITALIPAGKGEDGKNIRIADELKRNEALREQQKLYPQVFEMAQKIEGKVRHASIHAAGIIIAPDVITKYAPLFFKGNPDNRSEEDNFPTIQWDMYDAEERGMLKMDFLGLKTLRVIDQTERQIREVQKARGEAPTFDIDEIDRYDDPAWRVLAAGQTAGVFQIERGFVRNFARRMSLMRKDPWQLAILISIIRPGMMDTGATEEYLKRASGKSAPTPLDALLEETLRGNFGLFVFQEDCMWAAVRMAGLSLSKADELRRAIGKKKPKDMAAIKPEFIQGCIKNGATLERAEFVWQNMETFGRYGFNNAHAAAYGMVGSYQTAYLKANWPVLYMTNLINSEAGVGNKDDGYNCKVAEYVEESRMMGLKVLKPCVLKSQAMCHPVWPNQIRFGLSLVKKVSSGAVAWVGQKCRDAVSLKDFMLKSLSIELNERNEERPHVMVGKGDLEGLALSGALDVFEGNRSRILAMLPTLQELAKGFHEQSCKVRAGKGARMRKTPEAVMQTLEAYRIEDDDIPNEMTLERQLEREREVTGCYLSDSPFTPYKSAIDQWVTCTVGEILQGHAEQPMIFVAVLTKFREIVVKNGKNAGQTMAIMQWGGVDGDVETAAFSRQWADIKAKPGGVEKGKVYLVMVTPDRDGVRVNIKDILRLSNCGYAD
jgi:DNA polymerase-3 subunit alpha